MPVFLPPSLSDEVPIVLVKDNTDGDVTEYFEDQDETAHEVSDSVEADDGRGDESPGAWFSYSLVIFRLVDTYTVNSIRMTDSSFSIGGFIVTSLPIEDVIV